MRCIIRYDLCDEKMKDDVPLYIQRSLHSCIVVSQEGSHLLTIDESVKSCEAPYLLRSTVFELLNMLFWCKSLPSDVDSIEIMRAKTMALITLDPCEIVKHDVFEGIIGQDTSHRYFCGEYLFFSNDMQPNDLGNRVKINIKKRKDNTDLRTKDIYPYFVYRSNCGIFE